MALVGDRRMARLHLQYLNIPGATDVLSFPLDLDARRRVLTGEVVVCVPQAARQARVYGATLRDELLLCALHGMLHLCGFDDTTPRARRRMETAQTQLLHRLRPRAYPLSRYAGRGQG